MWDSFAPRPMQTAVAQLAKLADSPGIVIIESPMGEGKTEASLYLLDEWNLAGGGVYVAMPTMATSNQMYGRVEHYLRRRFPRSRVTLQRVHSAETHSNDRTSLIPLLDEERLDSAATSLAILTFEDEHDSFAPHKDRPIPNRSRFSFANWPRQKLLPCSITR